MTSIAQINENEQREIEGTLKKFFTDYRIGSLLKACRAEKQKGHSAFQIFWYLLCLVFCDRSMYMQIITGRYSEDFGKNTVYRFLNSARTNWERLTCMFYCSNIMLLSFGHIFSNFTLYPIGIII